MNTIRCFLKFTIPSLVILLAIFLLMHERYVEAVNQLKGKIQEQGLLINKLEEENDSLKKSVEKLKEDKYRYIKLDVTGVSHRGGGVVVNNSLCK